NLGGFAFAYCPSLSSVTIGNSVTTIGDDTFSHCSSLTNVTIGDSVTSIGSGAFAYCISLTNVTIPNSVISIGYVAFISAGLTSIYFEGNAPTIDSYAFTGENNATVYYLPGTTGWGPTFGGRPTSPWQPQVQTSDASFGVRTNKFGFNITWASGMLVVVE